MPPDIRGRHTSPASANESNSNITCHSCGSPSRFSSVLVIPALPQLLMANPELELSRTERRVDLVPEGSIALSVSDH